MLKELGLLFSCVSLFGNLQPQRNYSHTENLNAETTVTYKYESNEVNSTADLIRGNIYRFDFNELPSSYTDYFNCTMLVASRSGSLQMIFDAENDFSMNVTSNGSDCNAVVYNNNGSYVTLFVVDSTYVIFQYKNYFNPSYITHVSYTDYNVIENVTYTPPTTFIGVINEFCENYIFSEIPLVNEISFTVGGQQISLMTYIVIFVGLVCGVGLLILFIMLLKWLFLLVAGGFRLRR